MPMPRSPSASWTGSLPDSRLTAEANLLIMPNLDAANITFNALKIVAGAGRHGRARSCWVPPSRCTS